VFCRGWPFLTRTLLLSSKLPFWDCFSPLTFRFKYGVCESISGFYPGMLP
jgi:hypothetical protein